MSFFKAFYSNFTKPLWVTENKNKTGHAFGYFFLFVLFFTFLTFIPLFVGLPQGLTLVDNFLEEKVPNFTLTLADEKLSLENIPQPYIYGPNEDNFYFQIDTTKTAESIKAESGDMVNDASLSGLLIGQDEIHFFDNTSGQYQIQKISDFSGNFSFTRDDVRAKIQSINTITKTTGIVLFLILIASFFISLGKLMYLFMVAGIFSLIVSKKTTYKFTEIFTMGLYAITIPTLIKVILPFIPFLYTISLAVLLTYIVFPQIFKKKTTEKETEETKKEIKKEE
ncbi:MAG: DUF1189 family protein [Candidatus Magasanikbacteria bacterium]